jgi:hypothetical protein
MDKSKSTIRSMLKREVLWINQKRYQETSLSNGYSEQHQILFPKIMKLLDVSNLSLTKYHAIKTYPVLN